MPYTVYLETFWKRIRLDISYNNPKNFRAFAVPINADFYFNILEQNEALLTGFHPFWVGNII